jgi:SAM-dependent methyltransferase
MIREFIDLNIKCSKFFDNLFYRNNSQLLYEFLNDINKTDKVADIGGGKKPVKLITKKDFDCEIYEGLDFDLNELSSAPLGIYNFINTIDLNIKNEKYYNKYNKIFCLNTIEHISDVENALNELSKMLVIGGKCYIRVPCKYAFFAKLNLIINEDYKRKILFYIFPSKKSDGFPAYYHFCSINDFIRILSVDGVNQIFKTEKHLSSSYFYFFFPFYLIWRIVSFFQYLIIDDYCESFEMIFTKEKN